MSLEIAVGRSPDSTILYCRGRLVVQRGAAALREVALRELSAGRSLALDLASVTQLDAQGIGVLAELYNAAQTAGRHIVILGARDRVVYLLRLTRLDTFIHVLSLRTESREARSA